MVDRSNAQSPHPGNARTSQRPGGTPISPWLPRWNSAGVVAAVGVGLLWLLAHGLSARFSKPDPGESWGYAPPSPETPAPKPAARINNETAKLKLPPSLDGTAVIYPEEVSRLVADDGRFRTDLPAARLALLLRLNAQAIIRKGSVSEIDPDVVLFTAVAGRLTERAKALSRQVREYEAREGRPPSAAGYGWVKKMYPFTLRSLLSPTPEQKEILDAISRSARLVPKRPGEKINAIGLPITGADMTSAEVEFAGGFLPLESPPAQ